MYWLTRLPVEASGSGTGGQRLCGAGRGSEGCWGLAGGLLYVLWRADTIGAERSGWGSRGEG